MLAKIHITFKSGVLDPQGKAVHHALKDLGYNEGDFPESEKASKEVLSIPIYAELTDEQKSTVCDHIIGFFK